MNRIEQKGLITKVKDLERKNLVRAAITETGRNAYSQSTRRGSIQRIISSLAEEECQQLRVCLEKLRDRVLQEIGMGKLPYP